MWVISMIRELVKDEKFLSLKSSPASKKDIKVINDLLDTFHNWNYEHQGRGYCSGMAANMIGERKNIILINNGIADEIMINPVIVDKKDPYEAEEHCICLTKAHPALRYDTIIVRYRNRNFEPCTETFTGLTAQTIQHEIDHTKGIVI